MSLKNVFSKLLTSLFLLIFTVNSFAQTGASQEALKQVFDSHFYNLNVEWDQKDIQIHEKFNQEFIQNLEAVMVKHQLSKEDLLSFAGQTFNVNLEAAKLKYSVLSNQSSHGALAIALSSDLARQKGASWNGLKKIDVILGTLLASIIIYAVVRGMLYECVEYEYKYHCTGSYNEGNDWCGYGDVCVRSERKK